MGRKVNAARSMLALALALLMATARIPFTLSQVVSAAESYPGHYEITVSETINGSVEASAEFVDYGASYDVTVTPDEGYSVVSVRINGEEVTDNYAVDEKGVVTIAVTNVESAQDIEADFAETEVSEADITALFNSGDTVRMTGKTYVFGKDIPVIFSVDPAQFSGIRLYDENGELIENDTETSVTITSDNSVSEIRLKYKAADEMTEMWHNVAGVSAKEPLNLVIDNTNPKIQLTPQEKDTAEFYHDDFNVVVSLDETGDDSGIGKIEYFVTDTEIDGDVLYTDVSEDQKTQKGIENVDLYTADDYYTIPVTVTGTSNNSDYVCVWVRATDNAGNVTTVRTRNLPVNCTAPELVSVIIDGELQKDASEGYYNEIRTAQITIIDRASSFDEVRAGESIVITAKDAEGKDVEISRSSMISWSEGADENTHIATIVFSTDARYHWEISLGDAVYVNKAGMTLERDDTEEDGESIYSFVIDTNAPDPEINLDTSSGRLGWTQKNPVTRLLFKIWDSAGIRVEATAEDSISEIYDIQYYKTSEDTLLTADRLDELYEEGAFTDVPYTVTNDEKLVVYARITDYAGNTVYINTDGAVVDKTASMITITPEEDPNEYGYYNHDVSIDINVTEVVDGKSAYSGIHSISYQIVTDGKITREENLYTFDTEQPVYSDLEDGYQETITVDAGENNSDHVSVIVTAVDNAGNVHTENFDLSVNVDEIKAELSMNGAPYQIAEEEHSGYDRGYFNMDARLAVITVTDRAGAFHEQNATDGIRITAVDGNGMPVTDAYEISQWTTSSEDPDVHLATVIFKTDANYTWSFEYENKAGNTLDTEKNFYMEESTVAPFVFTLDTTSPTGTVSIKENIWNKIIRILTFGLYSNESVKVKASSHDATSPVIMEYYKTSDTSALTEEELDETEFAEYEDFSVDTDGQFTVYLKITDYAGNYTYISSDGYIIDKSASRITLIPRTANGFYGETGSENGRYRFYGADPEKSSEEDVVPVDILVEDGESCSGIQTIKYWVETDGVKTQEAILYSFDYVRDEGVNSDGGTMIITDWNSETQTNTDPVILEGAYPAQSDLKGIWNGTVEVNKALNNSCDVTLYVQTVDNAGNESEASVDLDIDVTDPAIEIIFDNGNGYEYEEKDESTSAYFDAGRTATIVITERSHHFNAEEATESIHITAVDARGNDISDVNDDGIPAACRITGWTTEENEEDPDAATHTATIEFLADANYTWSVNYADKAGNRTDTGNSDDLESKVTTSVENGILVAPFAFSIDMTAPTGTVRAVSAEGRETVWDETDYPRENFTFGFWSGDRITISGTQDDMISPIDSVEYYKVSTLAADGITPLTAEQLDTVTEWRPFDKLEMTQDEQFVVYLKITDRAKNYSYLSTNGLIVDCTRPEIEAFAPEITITPQQPVNGIYNRNVAVDIEVADPLTGGICSGLKMITYRVLNLGEETQSGTLYLSGNEEPVQSELRQSWSGRIIVDSLLNNSNDVKIEVYVEDNALNSCEADTSIKIDRTDPVIEVSYDNNSADSSRYFNRGRRATIVVVERNFNPDDIRLDITNTDGGIPSLSSWTRSGGTGNGDDTRWTATLDYAAEGDYTFDIQYSDLAGNVSPGPEYGNSVAPEEFTIDKTLPAISVSYSNNNASNGRYFAAPRTATIVVTEHNFDVSRVVFTQTASLGGSPVSVPPVSWSSNGDVHTASITYSNDGDYTFDVAVMDLAGNESGEADYGRSIAPGNFVIDQTIEKPVISGVENGNAYTGDVIPVISFRDTNYASYEITLLRTRMGEKNADVTDQFIDAIAEQSQGGSGTYDTFDRVAENDGIYTLTVCIVDLAGNEETETITFTLNRFGSVYEYSDYLVSLIRDGGQYITIKGSHDAAVTEDLVITEYSAGRLLEDSVDILITRDGEVMNAGYTTDPVVINAETTVGDSGWYEYEYMIDASNFAEDGVYRITLVSRYAAADSGMNESTSVPENSMDMAGNPIVDTMSFTVDTIPPEIRNISNLEEEIINAQSVEVGYTIVDVGGLASVEVMVNGDSIADITEFGEGRYNYSDSFIISENSDVQAVRLVATDRAGNVTDTAAEGFSTDGLYDFNDTVTVSTNFFVRWYANKPLFWGTILGVIVVAGGSCIIVVLTRRKKENVPFK